MMFFWISSVPPAMLAEKLVSMMVPHSSALSPSVLATRSGPNTSPITVRSRREMMAPCSLPSEPPGPGVRPAFISARVRMETRDLVVSSL
ncbi:unannotated protein [freshwater metagenome]|uniref:Unannotated protein n=1 Tax=freshwater metagenome TaxID=449393 RepID=A0A6J7EXB8_9ZZZZ